jgi:hypothetical protein
LRAPAELEPLLLDHLAEAPVVVEQELVRGRRARRLGIRPDAGASRPLRRRESPRPVDRPGRVAVDPIHELRPVLEERQPLVLDAGLLEEHADAVDVLEQLVAARRLQHSAGLVDDVGDHADLVEQGLVLLERVRQAPP